MTGYCTFINFGGHSLLIDWAARRQCAVSTSITEAELAAIHEAIQVSTLPLQELVSAMMGRNVSSVVFTDSQSAIRTIKNGFSSRLIHMSRTHEISLGWLKERSDAGDFVLTHVRSELNKSDIFTKPLERIAFERCRALLMGDDC